MCFQIITLMIHILFVLRGTMDERLFGEGLAPPSRGPARCRCAQTDGGFGEGGGSAAWLQSTPVPLLRPALAERVPPVMNSDTMSRCVKAQERSVCNSTPPLPTTPADFDVTTNSLDMVSPANDVSLRPKLDEACVK